ncbi:secreted protein [sediment metagenome]|uniref:Secreted protein n=1 Tax=sediment metagenome TaxID=749907 RepID=D9PLQ1_9ZZZZ
MKPKIILIFLLYSLVLFAQTSGFVVNVDKASTTYLTWKVPGNYTGYDSLHFVVKPCTTSGTCAQVVKKNCGVSYSKPYTTLTCTLYVDETASFNAAKYYFSIYAYGTDTVAVRSGTFNLQLNGQTPTDGIATATPYYTIALDTPNVANTFIVGQDSNNIWYRRTANAVRTILGIDTLTGATLIPDSVVYPYELDTLFTKTSHIVNVKEFGAVGDSTADDTDAIEAALTAVKQSTYGAVKLYFPYGIYRITSKITVQNLVGAIWEGEQGGRTFNYDGSILLWDGGNDDGMFEFNYVKNCTFEGLRFESSDDSTNRAWFGVKFKDDNGTLVSSSGNVFSNCQWANFDTALAYGDHNYNNDYNVSENKLEHCYFQNNVIGVFNAGATTASQNVNNYFYDTHFQAGTIGKTGFYWDGGHADFYSCSWGASVANAAFSCIYITGDRSLTQTMNIVGCYTEQTDYFIRTQYTDSTTYWNRSTAVNIIGSWLRCNNTGGDSTALYIYKNMNLVLMNTTVQGKVKWYPPTSTYPSITLLGRNNNFWDEIEWGRGGNTNNVISYDSAKVNLFSDQTIYGTKTIDDYLKFGTGLLWGVGADLFTTYNYTAGAGLYWDNTLKPNRAYGVKNIGDWSVFYFNSNPELVYKASSDFFYFHPDTTVASSDGSGAKTQFHQGDISVSDSTKGLMLKEESDGDWITLTGDTLDYLFNLIGLPDTTGKASGSVPKYKGDGTISWEADAGGAGSDSASYFEKNGAWHPTDSVKTIDELDAAYQPKDTDLDNPDLALNLLQDSLTVKLNRSEYSAGSGDMTKAVYDVNSNNRVDDADSLNGVAPASYMLKSDSTIYLTPADGNVAYQAKDTDLDNPDLALSLLQDSLTVKLNRSEMDLAPNLIQDSLDVKLNRSEYSAGSGDMTKAVYDVDDNGRIDDADSLGGTIASGYAKLASEQTFTAKQTFSNSITRFDGDSITVMGDFRYSTGYLTQAELSYLDGLDQSIVTLLAAKQATIPNIADTSKYIEYSDTTDGGKIATQYMIDSRTVAASTQTGMAMVHDGAWVLRTKTEVIDSLDLVINTNVQAYNADLNNPDLALNLLQDSLTVKLNRSEYSASSGDMTKAVYDLDDDGTVDDADSLGGTVASGYMLKSDSTIYLTPADGNVAYQPKDDDLTDLADGSLTASKVAGVADADYGDVTVSSGSWAVEDDSHNHVISNVDLLQDSLTAKANTAWFAISPSLIDDSITVKLNRSEMDLAPSLIQDSLTVKANRSELGTGAYATIANYAPLASPTFTGAITHAGIKIQTHTITTDSTLAAALCYGGVFYVTEAQTITLPAIASGMSLTFITVGAVAVSIDVNASDKMILDGTALADGDKATNTSTTGDMIVFTYYSADGWYAASGSNDGDLWTDGN